MRFVRRNVLARFVFSNLVEYPAPFTLNYFWNYGVLAGMFLMVQIVTGIMLAMYYIPSVDVAFLSVEHITRDVSGGWLLRYIHMNGASFFFLVVYLHIGRNLVYSSYLKPREYLWCSGMLLLLLMIVTAFLGYVLPWGQMSFWAATVITSLFTAVPYVGTALVIWLWGGYAVDSATLNRFFSLHYCLPFIMLFCVVVHLVLLHEHGSSSPARAYSVTDKIPFHPYFTSKDLVSILVMALVFGLCVFFFPTLTTHSDNYIRANPLVTPEHIVPEWYFLLFYAILRAVPNKTAGIVLLLLALVAFTGFVFFVQEVTFKAAVPRSQRFRRVWYFFWTCIWLVHFGAQPMLTANIWFTRLLTLVYFWMLIRLVVETHINSIVFFWKTETYLRWKKRLEQAIHLMYFPWTFIGTNWFRTRLWPNYRHRKGFPLQDPWQVLEGFMKPLSNGRWSLWYAWRVGMEMRSFWIQNNKERFTRSYAEVAVRVRKRMNNYILNSLGWKVFKSRWMLVQKAKQRRKALAWLKMHKETCEEVKRQEQAREERQRRIKEK